MLELRVIPRSAAAVIALAFVSGCGGNAATSDSAQGDTLAAALALACPTAPKVGDLTKDLSQYNATELEAVVPAGDWGTAIQATRDCNGQNCTGEIVPLKGLDVVSANIGSCGTILARMSVSGGGGGNEDVYDMQPGSHRYYLIAFPTTTSGVVADWTLMEVTGGSENLKEGKKGTITECPPHTNVPQEDAKFSYCPDTTKVDTRDPKESPAWMSCDQGCCTAGIT